CTRNYGTEDGRRKPPPAGLRLRFSVFGLRSSVFGLRSSVFGLRSSVLLQFCQLLLRCVVAREARERLIEEGDRLGLLAGVLGLESARVEHHAREGNLLVLGGASLADLLRDVWKLEAGVGLHGHLVDDREQVGRLVGDGCAVLELAGLDLL